MIPMDNGFRSVSRLRKKTGKRDSYYTTGTYAANRHVDAATPDTRLNRFVYVRIASIKQESAAGEGENTEALAMLMGKEGADAFSGWMKTHYDELFVGLEQPTQLLTRIESMSSLDQELRRITTTK
jgi:hypothetical protein